MERFFGWQGLINLVSGMGKSHHSKNSCWYSHKPDPAGPREGGPFNNAEAYAFGIIIFFFSNILNLFI